MKKTVKNGPISRPVDGSVKVVAQWVEALHGQGELFDVLSEIVGLVGATSGLLARLVDHDQARRIATVDAAAGRLPSPPLPHSHTKMVLRENLKTARPGSVWRLSEASTNPHFDAPVISDSGLRDVLVIVLDQQSATLDVLELHFRNDPREHDALLVSMLGPEFSTTWARRTPGCVQHSMAHLRLVRFNSAATREQTLPILHPNNPSGLSRSEFRICVMIGDGMKVKSIAEALLVCEATVRSHLTSIFSKTNTSGQIELIHRLMEPNGQLHSMTGSR